ncbi:MAG TPA: SpoIVB peptidase S55 domain-containing protein [Polyangiales bacterium]|nr:SpoIVB peptidase S55 domain-containing protein [Polyangiales bacterium]
MLKKRAALASLLLFASAGFTPASQATIAPSEVRPGMRGYGLTVFRGTEPERFDVEVIDVLQNFRPDQDLVLIKTPHPLLEHAGSVAGMSGSPIYLDGKLLGAYAYGWAFGKDPIAGVTPIANMLRELDRPLLHMLQPLPAPQPKPVQPLGRYTGGESRDAFYGLSRALRRSPGAQFQAAATPLLVGGMAPSVAGLLRDKLAPLGLEVLEAAGGSSAKAKDGPKQYVDGGSIAVSLIRGDVQATAVGTVTHVAGRRAIAFGHPMLELGELALPTATSRVLHILASERSSFKIAEALVPLGALIHDRQSAVVIDNEQQARTIPVEITLRGLPEGQRSHWQVEVADQRTLTGSLVLTALASAVGASVNDITDTMFSADSVVTLRGHGARHVHDEGFSPAGAGHPVALSRLRAFELLEAAYDNPFERTQIERISITLSMRFGHDVSEIVGAQLAKDELDPGEPARVVLTLRAFEGPLEQRVLEIPLPASYAGEHLELELGNAERAKLPQPLPRTLDDMLRAIESGYAASSLAVGIERKGRGLRIAGHVLRDLPGSALDALDTLHDTTRGITFLSEPYITLPMGRIVVGSAKLGLDVRVAARGSSVRQPEKEKK